jgi:hypothetical protein
MARGTAAPTGDDGGLGETEEGDNSGWAGLGRIGRAERTGCENCQGKSGWAAMVIGPNRWTK